LADIRQLQTLVRKFPIDRELPRPAPSATSTTFWAVAQSSRSSANFPDLIDCTGSSNYSSLAEATRVAKTILKDFFSSFGVNAELLRGLGSSSSSMNFAAEIVKASAVHLSKLIDYTGTKSTINVGIAQTCELHAAEVAKTSNVNVTALIDHPAPPSLQPLETSDLMDCVWHVQIIP
jgi:hypothetical protein